MILPKYNYHTHTKRCGHASGEDEEYILSAINMGYKILGFSDHIQYRFMKGQCNRIDYEDFNEYFYQIRCLGQKYQKDIKIFCGLEAEFIPECLIDLYEIEKYCDYLILGQHIGGINQWLYSKSCSEEDVLHYADDIEYAVRTGLFSMIAHPDYFMFSRTAWTNNCSIAAERICTIAKIHNIPIEFNLKGFKEPLKKIDNRFSSPYPFKKFWEIASEIQTPVIWGIDAHSPKDLNAITLYKTANRFLQDLSLNFQDDFVLNSRKENVFAKECVNNRS